MIVERRKDNLTATHVRDALRIQRDLVFSQRSRFYARKGCAQKRLLLPLWGTSTGARSGIRRLRGKNPTDRTTPPQNRIRPT